MQVSAMFNPVSYTAVQVKSYSKNTSIIKVATVKNTDDFHYEKGAIAKLTLFTISIDEWNTKEETCNSMHYICCGMAKAPLGLKQD